MTIAFVCALQDTQGIRAALLARDFVPTEHRFGVFARFTYGENFFLVICVQPNVAGVEQAIALLAQHNVDSLVSICGVDALDSTLGVGDIVIASKVYAYNAKTPRYAPISYYRYRGDRSLVVIAQHALSEKEPVTGLLISNQHHTLFSKNDLMHVLGVEHVIATDEISNLLIKEAQRITQKSLSIGIVERTLLEWPNQVSRVTSHLNAVTIPDFIQKFVTHWQPQPPQPPWQPQPYCTYL
jgi:hypothetical protein